MVDVQLKNFKILGAGVSIGQPKKGVEQTPEILREEQIEGLIRADKVEWIEILKEKEYEPEESRTGPINNIKELGEYNHDLFSSIVKHVNPDDFLLTIGGDHSLAATSISALLQVHGQNLGVIWIDAHGDTNTPQTSISGNFHGMPVAHVLGLFKDEHLNWGQPQLEISQIALIGVRDLDPLEKDLMDEIGILYFTNQQVFDLGIDYCISAAMRRIDPDKENKIHLSLDVDGFDPSLFPGTGTIAERGITMDHYKVIVDRLKECGERFVSMDLVEVNFLIEKERTLESVKEILKITFS